MIAALICCGTVSSLDNKKSDTLLINPVCTFPASWAILTDNNKVSWKVPAADATKNAQ